MRSLLTSAIAAMAVIANAAPYLELEIAGEANGKVVIDLDQENAPLHVERIVTLANDGAYDNIAFHRVISGFMAQTGDVEFGNVTGDIARAGMGGSEYDDLPAEFSDVPFDRGVVGMARSQMPNSANSQFFIMFQEGHFLNNQYTVIGTVVEGMDIVDTIKQGSQAANGAIEGAPDYIAKAVIKETLEEGAQ